MSSKAKAMATILMFVAGTQGAAGAVADEQGGRSMDDIRFPRVSGSNLAGREFDLPGDFEGDLNLVFVAYQREQQALVDTWLPLARRLAGDRDWLATYELPTIARQSFLVRWFIDSGMRRGIPDEDARESTITLYLDKEPFNDALGIASEHTIHAFLVDRDGGIRWSASGPLVAEHARSLVDALDLHEFTASAPPRRTHLRLVPPLERG